jgi:pyridoxine 5-phosphate synthase
MKPLRLSVNVDHVATLRNARGGAHPCPVEAAKAAILAGADGITIHLREDRRHILDADAQRIRAEVAAPLTFEMSPTSEMIRFCENLAPHACCMVPERRAELTTEGGLDVLRAGRALADLVAHLGASGIRVALFVEPDLRQVEAAAAIGASAVELHTGTYADAPAERREAELSRLGTAARAAVAAGLACHAGHGLTYANVGAIAAIQEVTEASIGHFLLGQAVFEGLPTAVRRMKEAILLARSGGRAIADGGP